MPSLSKLSQLDVAVIGGGAAGYTAAILLANAGVRTTLLEAQPAVLDIGSGIMLQANALRVLREAGALSAVLAGGFGFDSTGIRLPDETGRLVGELSEGRMQPDLPSAVGIARTRLARILHDRAQEVNVDIRLGTRVSALRQSPPPDVGHDDGLDSAKVHVTALTGSAMSTMPFDLVVAADGVNSSVRTMIGITSVPRLMPLGVWRVRVPRPATVVRTEIINGGPAYFAGYAPISDDAMYAWLVEDYHDHRALTPAQQVEAVRTLMAGYHGPWDAIRDSLTADTPTNYTRYSEFLLNPPWHRGRVLLIGDAAHSCPPTMAQGAAQALEDASVFVEMLTGSKTIDEDLFRRFTDRRLPRIRAVVEGSVQMAEWQLRHERGDIPALMARTSRLLSQPA